MGFFASLTGGLASIVSAAAPIGAGLAQSGALGPTAAIVSPALAGARGPTGVGGRSGIAGAAREVAQAALGAGAGSAFTASMNGGRAGIGVGLAAAARTEAGQMLMNLLAVNGIHPAPTSNIKATVVILLTPEGAVVDSVRRGTPKVMSRDVQIAKRVAKVVKKLHGKLPTRTVQASLTTQINETVKRTILGEVSAPLRRIAARGDTC